MQNLGGKQSVLWAIGKWSIGCGTQSHQFLFFYNAHFTHPFPLTDNNYESIIYNMNAFQNDFYSLPGFEQFSTLTNATFGFPSPLQTKLVRPRYLFFQPNHEGNI